jgi:8-oxo-dGTP pyrophosphatase MutT (NUDIX family)
MIPLSFDKQSGVLPYKIIENRLWILLITSQTTRRWIIPKGYVEPQLSARESAELEAFEEAGIIGTVKFLSLGAYRYQKSAEKGGRWCRVRVYPMKIAKMFDDYPERNTRSRELMPIGEALSRVANEELREIIETFASKNPT